MTEEAVNDGATQLRATDLSGAIPASGGNVDKIRDILFGSQMKDYERRFARLEERMLKEISESRDDTRRRIEGLDSFLRQEISTLTERLQTEQNERSDALKAAGRSLQDANDSLERRIGQLGSQSNDAQRDLRQQLLDQSNQLRDEFRRKTDEISSLLDRSVQELRSDKTDRSALAALLTEVAMRLNDEFTISTE